MKKLVLVFILCLTNISSNIEAANKKCKKAAYGTATVIAGTSTVGAAVGTAVLTAGSAMLTLFLTLGASGSAQQASGNVERAFSNMIGDINSPVVKIGAIGLTATCLLAYLTKKSFDKCREASAKKQ